MRMFSSSVTTNSILAAHAATDHPQSLTLAQMLLAIHRGL